MPDVIRSLLMAEEEGPVMVTTWAVVCEYLDENGSANVAAWASNDPPWRIGGLIAVAGELLDTFVYDTEDEDEYEDDD